MAFKDEACVIEYTSYVVVRNGDIIDIMSCALESGGIAYWCDYVEPIEGRYYNNSDACEHIARGGKLRLHLTEGPIEKGGPASYELTRGKLLKGISEYLGEDGDSYNVLNNDGMHTALETCNIDACVCDTIIRYALFDEVVFG